MLNKFRHLKGLDRLKERNRTEEVTPKSEKMLVCNKFYKIKVDINFATGYFISDPKDRSSVSLVVSGVTQKYF